MIRTPPVVGQTYTFRNGPDYVCTGRVEAMGGTPLDTWVRVVGRNGAVKLLRLTHVHWVESD